MAPEQQKSRGNLAVAKDTINQSFAIAEFGSGNKFTITMDDVFRLLVEPTKSGQLPSNREVTLFLKFCEARGLNPFVKDAYLLGYDTKNGAKFDTIVAYQALLKRAEAHPQYAGKQSGVIVYDARQKETVYVDGDVFPNTMTLIGGWCRVLRRDRMHHELITARLKSYDKGYGYWQVDPGWMICKCACAKAFRSAFPNETQGMYTEDEHGSDDDRSSSPRPRNRLISPVPVEQLRQITGDVDVSEEDCDAPTTDELQDIERSEAELFEKSSPNAAEV